MGRYVVRVVRTVECEQVFAVTAPDEDAAEVKACELAGKTATGWQQTDSGHEVQDVALSTVARKREKARAKVDSMSVGAYCAKRDLDKVSARLALANRLGEWPYLKPFLEVYTALAYGDEGPRGRPDEPAPAAMLTAIADALTVLEKKALRRMPPWVRKQLKAVAAQPISHPLSEENSLVQYATSCDRSEMERGTYLLYRTEISAWDWARRFAHVLANPEHRYMYSITFLSEWPTA